MQVSTFCRHNRFTADCPICSKGTVLDANRAPARRPSAGRGQSRQRGSAAATPTFIGPHTTIGPYDDGEGGRYVVRFERVPGGARMAEWSGSRLRRRAPVVVARDLTALLGDTSAVLPERDGQALADALRVEPARADARVLGVSRGRSGDFEEELRVEGLDDGLVRVGRWVQRPTAGWELQDAPPMLPAVRFAEALQAAVHAGLSVASGSPASERP